LTDTKTRKRAAVLVSSTSWTEDEDFGMLLSAVAKYDEMREIGVGGAQGLPPLVLLITGKGPLKAFYEQEIAKMGLRHVAIYTLWLAAEDYPKVLASADIGISLHTSSSKLDLPMKVVDMLGAGLPVCALTYPTLTELLPADGSRGCHFEDGEGLLRLLKELLTDFPTDNEDSQLARMKRNIIHVMQDDSWDNAWTQVVAPIFQNT